MVEDVVGDDTQDDPEVAVADVQAEVSEASGAAVKKSRSGNYSQGTKDLYFETEMYLKQHVKGYSRSKAVMFVKRFFPSKFPPTFNESVVRWWEKHVAKDKSVVVIDGRKKRKVVRITNPEEAPMKRSIFPRKQGAFCYN